MVTWASLPTSGCAIGRLVLLLVWRYLLSTRTVRSGGQPSGKAPRGTRPTSSAGAVPQGGACSAGCEALLRLLSAAAACCNCV